MTAYCNSVSRFLSDIYFNGVTSKRSKKPLEFGQFILENINLISINLNISANVYFNAVLVMSL